jgi:hypothetical protein
MEMSSKTADDNFLCKKNRKVFSDKHPDKWIPCIVTFSDRTMQKLSNSYLSNEIMQQEKPRTLKMYVIVKKLKTKYQPQIPTSKLIIKTLFNVEFFY